MGGDRDRASRGGWRRVVSVVLLGAACAACQSSLDLDQYSFTAGATIPESAGGVPGEAGTTSGGAGASPAESGSAGAGGATAGGMSGSGGAGGADGSSGAGGSVDTGGSSGVPTGSAVGSLKQCPDDELLLDDMEDDPAWICPHHGRTANEWYSFTGSSNEPSTATFSPMPFAYEPIPGGRMGSERAIHVSMSTPDEADYAGFGVAFSVATQTLPFDASAYGGLSFYARGSGTVLVRLSTAETIPVALGGRCVEAADEPCYNDHNVVLELADAWQLYQYSFADFMPAGYGPAREFDPSELFNLIISQEFGQAGIDIWVDDIWFLPGATAE